MAFSNQTVPTNLGTDIIIDEDAGSIGQDHVIGAAGTILVVMIDATLNKEGIYLKLCDTASVTVDTVRPEMQFFCPGGDTIQYTIPEGIAFAAGISYFLAQESGAAIAPTAPTGKVKVYLTLTT